MSDKVLPINEMYTCLQGEGKLMGVPHILIRVSGCRLRCQFADSFCDTPYSSWKPEKGKFTYQDVDKFFEKHPHIHHTMITGGGPTLHGKMLQKLCEIAKKRYHHITIETEGSEFVSTMGDLISLSPKLSNSTPKPETTMPFTVKIVTEKDKEWIQSMMGSCSSFVLFCFVLSLPPWLTPLELKETMPVPVIGTADKSR